MLDNFKEWISDNLRYILLGLAGILLLVIAFFAIRLVSGLGSPKEKKPEQEAVTEGNTEAGTERRVSSTLVKDQADVLKLIKEYYSARGSKNYDAIADMYETFDDKERSDVEKSDTAVESYSNIMTYSKPGLTDGSYVVFIYFDAKLTGVTTLVPGLRGLYLITNNEGKLLIADTNAHPEQEAYLKERMADDDVQALSEDVDTKLENAKASDPELKKLLEPDSSQDTPQTDSPDGGDGGTPVTGTTTGTMVATTEVNVRGEASADAALYGVLTQGQSVEVLENLESGWSKIRYTANGTTIEGYVMSQYLG